MGTRDEIIGQVSWAFPCSVLWQDLWPEGLRQR